MKPIHIIIGVLALMLASCAKDILPPEPTPIPTEDPTMTTVRFDFGVDTPVAATRAVNETAITNLQLLLIGSDGTRYFYEPGNKTSVTAQIKRGVYTVYACTNNPVRLENQNEVFINYFYSQIITVPLKFEKVL